jgi:hypothetical protein
MKFLVIFLLFFNPININAFSLFENKSNVNHCDSISFSYGTSEKFYNLILVDNISFRYIFIFSDTLKLVYEISGTYTIFEKKILLNPISIITHSQSKKNHINNAFQKTDYNVSSIKIKTNYDIIKYGNKIYLVSPENSEEFRIYNPPHFPINEIYKYKNIKTNDYYDLAQVFNRGLNIDSPLPFLQRTIDSIQTIHLDFDLSQIPNEFQDWFLNKSITASIVKCDSCHTSQSLSKFLCDEFIEFPIYIFPIYIIELDKGISSKIRPGIQFFGYYQYNTIFIIEATENSCIGISIFHFQKNDIVKTQWVDNDF